MRNLSTVLIQPRQTSTVEEARGGNRIGDALRLTPYGLDVDHFEALILLNLIMYRAARQR